MTTIREKIQEIIHDNFEIYGDGTVKMRPDNAEIQLEALFKEEWLGMVGKDEKPNKKHMDKKWGEGYSCDVCSGIESQSLLKSELRAKVEGKI